jgi:hypothetical protein
LDSTEEEKGSVRPLLHVARPHGGS